MLLLGKLILFGFAVLCSCPGKLVAGQTAVEPSSRGAKALAIERMQNTDKLREIAAEKSLQIIADGAKAVIAAGGDRSSAILCEEGFKTAFGLLASCRKSLNDGFVKAHNLAFKDPEAAVSVINEAIQDIINLIFLDSLPVQTVQGVSLVRVGELARPGLRAALELLHHCGMVLFETVNSAKSVATQGVKAGGDAVDISLVAAHEIFNTGEEVIYKLLIDSAEHSFRGLTAAAGKAPVRGFTARPDSLITNETPEAQLAIDELTFAFNKTLKVLSTERKIAAAEIMYPSFLSSIFKNANAIVKAYRALDGAEQQLEQDPEVAVKALHRGLVAVDNAILAVSADAILGIAAAGELCNEEVTEKLKPSIVTIVEGRVHLYTDLTLAEKVAVLGLRAGGVSAIQGLIAARASVAAASNTLFIHYINAARRAFNVVQNAC